MVSLFTNDAFSASAYAALRARLSVEIVSDFGAAEFASAIARRFRMRIVTEKEAVSAFADFDHWRARVATHVVVESADVVAAETIIRRLDLPLRAPDALHIAIAQRLGAELATFDEKMKSGAQALGLPLTPL
jgi:predicted nucleic acid-binding protein